MKISGTELIEFMDNGWPGHGTPESDDWYWDHDVFDEPDPAETYDTEEIGPIMWQGRGYAPAKMELSLASLIRKWRKDRSYDNFSFSVPKEKSGAVIAALAALGIKVTAP